MPPSRLGPLAIESKLGDSPSQSSVWRAIHVQLQRAVAVKIFSTPFGGTPEGRQAFADEWEQLKKLQHPSLVKCYGGGFEKSDAYLAYEMIEGETLAAQLERRGRLSWEIVLDFAEPLIDALKYLHKREIVYEALDPSKIVFAGLSPVLVDTRVDRSESAFQTRRPSSPLELSYVAPERFEEPPRNTIQSDLYSFGAILYHALTGRPPVMGDSPEEIAKKLKGPTPESPASIVMDCPVWMDKLVMQLLSRNPASRHNGAAAVALALAEVRRRSASRKGVAEHVSSGFSPLNVTDQKERDEARVLLGRDAVTFDDQPQREPTAWHDSPLVLVTGLVLLLGLFVYAIMPPSEDQMRESAEELIAEGNRIALNRAKVNYLEPMLERFPDGEHTQWAREQLDEVEMVQAEQALSVKLKRNLPLKNEGERLYAEANQFERFGDAATALDRYRSMLTLLADDPEYRPYVNLARRQIAQIEGQGGGDNEAARIIRNKLAEADKVYLEGEVVAARKIWYSVVELYGNHEDVEPLVAQAQQKLANAATRDRDLPQSPQTGTPADDEP